MSQAIINADKALSVCWKKTSHTLLTTAKDFESFADAVKWCGKVGNVTRTVSNKDFPDFVEYILDNKEDILNGNFELVNVKAFSGSKPVSWVSKICHILNPQKYPYIYDQFILKHFDITTAEEYDNLNLSLRVFRRNTSNEDAYSVDSEVWATEKNKKDNEMVDL